MTTQAIHASTTPLPRVLLFSSKESLARRGSEMLLDRIREILDKHPRATIVLSGGATPALLYRSAAYSLRSWPVSEKKRIHWFFSDERMVGPEDSQSNYRMARESLFGPAEIPESTIHRIRGEDPVPDREALRYEKDLTHEFGSPVPHTPSLDLVLLGIGPDGHTASLFPGSSPEDDHHRMVLSVPAFQGRIARISLSYRTLASAKTRIFLVTGREKLEILARALAPEGSLPSQLVLREANAHSLPSEFWIDRDTCPPGIEHWTDLQLAD